MQMQKLRVTYRKLDENDLLEVVGKTKIIHYFKDLGVSKEAIAFRHARGKQCDATNLHFEVI